MKGLLIRMDDITPDMNWDKFDKLVQIFDHYDIKPLLGIVPDNKDPQLQIQEAKEDFAQRMLQLQCKGYHLAQHGYQHLYVTDNGGMLNVHKTSEFAGLPFSEQLEKVLLGKERLEQMGIATNIFMAPGHAYDETTLKALYQARFVYVTDGYGTTPYIDKGLQFIPCTLVSVKERDGIDTICLHANTMSDHDIDQLEKSIAENKDRFITWQQALEMEKLEKDHKIARQEQLELKERKTKALVGSNDTIQDYMQKTYANNRLVKIMKRIAGLPRLGIRLMINKNRQ